MKDKFIVVKVVNIFHFISPNSDIIKDQTKDDPMLSPPKYLRLVLHNSMSSNLDVLEHYPVQVSWSSLALLRTAPWRMSLHHDLEVMMSGKRIFHNNVPEEIYEVKQ